MVNSENSLLLKCEYFGIFRQWLCFFMVFRKFSLYFLKISNFLFLRFLWSLIQSPQTKQCYQMGGGLPLLYLLVSSPLSLLIFLAKLANWIYKVYLDTLSARLNLRFLYIRLIARCSLPPVQLLTSPPSVFATSSRLRQRFSSLPRRFKVAYKKNI